MTTASLQSCHQQIVSTRQVVVMQLFGALDYVGHVVS
jgi:hypothetical protein